jgi:proteic killer suppression protein
MITSFGSKETEKMWNGDRVRNLPQEIQQIGRRKLRMLNNSQNLIDLKVPPSNKLEKLSGKMSDFYSVRINNQLRIVFKWDDGNSSEVTIMNSVPYQYISNPENATMKWKFEFKSPDMFVITSLQNNTVEVVAEWTREKK